MPSTRKRTSSPRTSAHSQKTPQSKTNVPKFTKSQMKEQEKFLNAVKKDAKDNNALHNYFKSFTDDEIASICKLVNIKNVAKNSRSVNTKLLIQKIRDNRSTYLEIGKMGITAYLTALFGQASLLSGISLFYSKQIGDFLNSDSNNGKEKKSNEPHYAVAFILMLSTSFLGLITYFSGKSFKGNWVKGKKRQQSTIRKINNALAFKYT